MEKQEVIGYYLNSFDDKSSGKKINYAKLYLKPCDEPKKGELFGIMCNIVSIRPELLETVELGDIIQLYYNQFGKVEMLQVVENI